MNVDIPDLAGLRPLLGEIDDLKRIRTAGHSGSLAERGFARAWADLVDGSPPAEVAARETAAAVAGARLGGIDAAVLLRSGLTPDEARSVLQGAINAVSAGIDPATFDALHGATFDLVDRVARPDAADRAVPPFVARLAAQPRAGATRPGHARLMLEPPESHADHCQTTAVFAALVARPFGADPAVAFLAALAHHFHNAVLPDGGFAGEELLGPHLPPIMDRLTAEALAQLPTPLAETVVDARRVLDHADSPEARAFHAADVLDRVLQMAHYERAASFRMRQALHDLDLVHPGPLQALHLDVLARAGLYP